MQMTRLTQRSFPQQQNISQVQPDNQIIAEFISASSTPAVTKQPAWKTLKRFQGLSYFDTPSPAAKAALSPSRGEENNTLPYGHYPSGAREI